MDGLRWWLLLFGLLVVAGVYFYTRFQRTRPDEPLLRPDATRLEPSIGGTPDSESDDMGTEPPSGEFSNATMDSQPGEAVAQKIVTLRLVAAANSAFKGDELVLSLRGIGLRHGKFGIFHRYEGSDEDKVVFSAASLVEPGSFDLNNIREQKIPGISLFMVLPGPLNSVQAFDLMMVAAKALSQSLQGELLDESGSTLSIQRERYMREEIIEFETSNLVA
jgi:cell division protein ZipA